jgi:hypothetical protein
MERSLSLKSDSAKFYHDQKAVLQGMWFGATESRRRECDKFLTQYRQEVLRPDNEQ